MILSIVFDDKRFEVKVFVIHLERAISRKKHMDKELSKIDHPYEFVSACDYKNLVKEDVENIYDEEKAVKEYGRSLVPSEIACARSHIDLWKHIIDKKIPYALILEDDITFLDPIALEKILEAPKNLAPHWEIILLAHGLSRTKGFGNPTWFFYKKKLQGNTFLKRPIINGTVAGALGYLVNLRGIKKLLTQLPISEPIDNYTGRDHLLNLYCISPPIIEEAPLGMESTLQKRNASIAKILRKDSLFKKKILSFISKDDSVLRFFIRLKSFVYNSHKVYNPFLKLRKYS